jgi:Hemerythrin HHE cation binding domain
MPSLAARRTATTTAPSDRPRSDQPVVAATPYDPHLIESLKSDHASLKATLDLLEHYILHQEFAKIPGMLARFSDALQYHLDEERDHFYRYVALCVQDDAAKSAFVERTNAHMEGIARQIMIFTRHYKSIGVSRVNKDAFRHDLEVISDLLGERIELEETSLYALYQPDHGHGHGRIDASPHELAYATR